MEATIEVTGLRKRFGPTLALDGMTFTVDPGQVTGFVGPNGAGKSTTMRVVLGLDAAEQGTALIGGQRYQDLRHPLSHVGSLLDAGALQPSRSARNHLLWLAHSQGLNARRVDEVVGQAGLQSAITCPRPTTIRWSAEPSSSLIRWLETSTARPWAASDRRNPRIHTMPSGSMPLNGSSIISTGGSPSSAAAIPSRCRMPREYPPAFRRITPARPACSVTSSTRRAVRPCECASHSR